MARLIVLMLQHPFQSLLFVQSFAAQVILIFLKRILLPHFPVYQSLRLQLQRAYLAAANVAFPDIVHRLPIGDVPQHRARKIDPALDAYLIPGSKRLSTYTKGPQKGKRCVIIYAHGGGYARGEAKMYMNYMERWVERAAQADLDIVFLSVEYRMQPEELLTWFMLT
jgi:acetyl esterase/lipase